MNWNSKRGKVEVEEPAVSGYRLQHPEIHRPIEAWLDMPRQGDWRSRVGAEPAATHPMRLDLKLATLDRASRRRG